MDNYVNSKIKSTTLAEPDSEYVSEIVNSFKILSNNNPESLIREINQNKNHIHSIDNIFRDLNVLLSSAKLSREIKRIIFYHAYYNDLIVRNNELLNHKNRRKIHDVKLRKPNNYTGKVGESDVHFRVVSKEDLIIRNYKIMEIYGIGLPYIDLNFKNILVTENNQKVDTPLQKDGFVQILTILRQFNSNNLFVYFNKWNIRRVGKNYYLLNLQKIFTKSTLDYKRQITLLLKLFEEEIDLSNFKNRIEIYDEIVKTDFLIKRSFETEN